MSLAIYFITGIGTAFGSYGLLKTHKGHSGPFRKDVKPYAKIAASITAIALIALGYRLGGELGKYLIQSPSILGSCGRTVTQIVVGFLGTLLIEDLLCRLKFFES